MDISPNEAEQALAAVQTVTQRTRQSLASSGAYLFLILTGAVWLLGFVATQFLPAQVLGYVWTGLSLLACIVSIPLGVRLSRRIRNPALTATAKRGALFWLFLAAYAIAAIAVARPTDGKQVTMLIILFTMLGQVAMGLLVNFSAVWWALPITAIALAGYYLMPAYFYLWLGILVGGGMIALGLVIFSKR